MFLGDTVLPGPFSWINFLVTNIGRYSAVRATEIWQKLALSQNYRGLAQNYQVGFDKAEQ